MVAGLESFNRSVSHDLRGPLGGVATLTRLAIDAVARGDTARALPMLDAVAGQADSLGKLVTDLLTLARVGDATLAVRPVDLGQCMQEATEQLRLAGQAVGAVEAVKADALGSVHADAGLLRQVFVNLIGNALKFSRGAAQPQVRVEMTREPDRVVVAVRDNGAGFAPERAGELFEPFRRLHGAAFEGTGLGLTIVRRIVERHGGSVWAEGRPGQGASFYVSLRTAPAD
jgi:signal transduction histidine kinase